MKQRGFFSVITATLAVFLMLFLAGTVFSMRGTMEAGRADLSAKIVSDHFYDSVQFYNSTIQDAILDIANTQIACGAAGDLCANYDTTIDSYLSASALLLSEPVPTPARIISEVSENGDDPFDCDDTLGTEVIGTETMDKYRIDANVLISSYNPSPNPQAKITNKPLDLSFYLYSYYDGANHHFILQDDSGATYAERNTYYDLRFSCS